MAKTSQIDKNVKRRILIEKLREKRQKLKIKLKDKKLSMEEYNKFSSQTFSKIDNNCLSLSPVSNGTPGLIIPAFSCAISNSVSPRYSE